MNKEDKIALFAKEINAIKDDGLKKLATAIIFNADDYFFTIPASSSGKHHPPFSLGEGGLVRHTKCVVYIARCIAESFNFSSYDIDAITVAAIAHDIKKQGLHQSGHTVHEHPILAAYYIMNIWEKLRFNIPFETVYDITTAIQCHMGKWWNLPEFIGENKPLPMPTTNFDKVLQAADYLASRKVLLEFDFE